MLATFFVVNSFAQRAYDRIILNDSTVENCIVKSVQVTIIQYSTYNIETKKEGGLRIMYATEIARIEYADGHVQKGTDLLRGIYDYSTTTPKKESNNPIKPKTPAITNSAEYQPSLIIKTDLVNDAAGFLNLGFEKSLNRSFTFEGFLGYAGQNKTGTYYFYENNNYYEFDANLKSGGIFSMAAIKWYPGISNRRMDYIFHSDGIASSPHGWNLALREKFTLMGTRSKMTYTNSNQEAQSSGGLVLATGTTLDLGYQQSHIFKFLSFEMFGGLGYLYRNSAAVNVISPGGVKLPIIPRYNKIGLATSWGFTIGVDLEGIKNNL